MFICEAGACFLGIEESKMPTATPLQKIHGRWTFFTMSIGRVYMKIEAENYSAGEIAPIGHTSAQVPQSTHTFGSIL